MKIASLVFLATLVAALSGCSTVSSSALTGPKQPAWKGQVFVSEEKLPQNVKHTVIGTVQAKARAGYRGAESLYTFLAAEARKIGANAVVGVSGGRQVTAVSWSAPYVSGTAVRVENVQELNEIPGKLY